MAGFGSYWWYENPPVKQELFGGKIIKVSGLATLESTDLYLRETKHSGPDATPAKFATRKEKSIGIKQFDFMAISDKPFVNDENFTIYYWLTDHTGNYSKNYTINIWYTPEKNLKYTLGHHPKTNEPILKKIKNPNSISTQSSIILFPPAYGQRKSDNEGSKKTIRKVRVIRSNDASERISASQIISGLQDERTFVAKKLKLLETFELSADDEFLDVFSTISGKEPMALTILDLTRHTDPLVSFSATKLVDRIDLSNYIEMMLRTDDAEYRKMAIEILSRISQRGRKRILNTAKIDSKELSRIIPRVLIPTGSRQGDRYYIKAIWDNRVDFHCLAMLFNEQLLHGGRSLVAEKSNMQKMNGRRFVYWYSKEWVLFMAKEIENCHARAEFVSGITFAPVRNTKW